MNPEISQSTSRILIEPLDRYLKNNAFLSMATHDLRGFLPLEFRGHTVALRSPIYAGGCEIALPVSRRLPPDSILDLLEVLQYYRRSVEDQAHSPWRESYILYRDGTNLGMLSSDERGNLHQNPGACFYYLLDVREQRFYRRLSGGVFESVHFATGQIKSILGLFYRLRTWLSRDLDKAEYRQSNGEPFEYDSAESFRVQRNAAIRLLNQHEELVQRKGTKQSPEYCLDPGGRVLGLLIPRVCIGAPSAAMMP